MRLGGESAAHYGTRYHTHFSAAARAAGYWANRRIPGTLLRPDLIDFANKRVVELKPNNARAVQLGARQLEAYIKALERLYGGKWSGEIWTYEMPAAVKFGLGDLQGAFSSGLFGGTLGMP
jgi:hypothetical protein